MEVTSLKQECIKDLTKRMGEILEENYFKRIDDSDYFEEEIYVDYQDKGLSQEKVAELLENENPKEAFEDLLSEWASDYEMEYGYGEMCKMLRMNLSEEEKQLWDKYDDEIREWLQEHVLWYYDENDYRTDVKINIMLDTGDGNYDFTKNNVLNYYGSEGDGSIDELSPILWLAKQQGKEQELVNACKAVHNREEYKKDNFVESVVQELENICSHMSTLTFLVKMDLFQLFDLQVAINKEKPLVKEYYPQDSETRGTIVISKDTMCGLFDPWQGGGSVLEIKLDKDVELPIKFIWKAAVEKHGGSWNYGVDEVYGLVDSAWNGKVKEIHPMEDEVK